MSDHQKQALSWAQDQLPAKPHHQTVIAQTAYSYVVQFETDAGIYYLKQTPPSLYGEASVLKILETLCGVRNAPKVMAHHDELHCFVMPSYGDQTLRHIFESDDGKGFDFALYQKGADTYLDIQRKTAPHLNAFRDVVADWRSNNLAAVYAAFLDDKPYIDAWSLSDEKRQQLARSDELVAQLIKDLSALDLPDVLLHCDFHPNAMLMDEKSAAISIIDWGEVAIGNPLLPFADCITQSLNNRYRVLSDAALTRQLIQHVFDAWNVAFTEENQKVFMLIGPLAAILSYYRLMLLSDYIFPKWKNVMPDICLDWLCALESHYGRK